MLVFQKYVHNAISALASAPPHVGFGHKIRIFRFYCLAASLTGRVYTL